MHLCLSIRDRFRESPTYGVVLTGYLHTDHVEIMFYGDPRAWRRDEELVAISAFQQFGLVWFESFSDTEVLIERFERELREGVKRPLTEHDKFIDRVLLRQRPRKEPRRPPINHFFLSLLYDEAGDRIRSCAHCREWLTFLGDWEVNAADRQHALAQMAKMGCLMP
jgi:hypothetical protein